MDIANSRVALRLKSRGLNEKCFNGGRVSDHIFEIVKGGA